MTTEVPEKFIPEKHRTQREDPAPKRTQRPLDQITAALNDITLGAQEHVTELRDLFDDISRNMKTDAERMAREYAEFAGWCQAIIDCKKVVSEGVAPLRSGKTLNARLSSMPSAPVLDSKKANGGTAV